MRTFVNIIRTNIDNKFIIIQYECTVLKKNYITYYNILFCISKILYKIEQILS